MTLTFVAPHRISVAQFTRVLQQANSPAAPFAAVLADIPGRYGLDRAVALAFFGHESTFGKAGICKDFDTRNWGNVRRPYKANRATIINPPGRGPFAKFATWQGGLEDWCERIRFVYVDRWQLTTVEAALVKYAPSSDGNRPAAYAAAVAAFVARWQREDAPTAPAPTGPLYESPNGPTPTLTLEPRPYRLLQRANVRQGPAITFPIAAVLDPMHTPTVSIDAVQYSQEFNGETRWCHLTDGRGFIHRSLVEAL